MQEAHRSAFNPTNQWQGCKLLESKHSARPGTQGHKYPFYLSHASPTTSPEAGHLMYLLVTFRLGRPSSDKSGLVRSAKTAGRERWREHTHSRVSMGQAVVRNQDAASGMARALGNEWCTGAPS